MTPSLNAPPELLRSIERVRRISLIAAGIGTIACVAGLILAFDQFFRSYLMAYLFWIGIALGCLALEMLQFLTGGRWGVTVRRLLEASANTLPVLAVLFLPIFAGMHVLYPWTHPEIVAAEEVLQHRQPYLNVPFFVVRAILYFAVWIAFALLLHRAGEDQLDRSKYVAARRLSAGGLIVYVFSVTFASIDWAQSLQPQWYSTMWGFLFVAAQCLAAVAFTITAAVLLSRAEPFATAFTRDRLHELGKLLLTFVMLWAYFSFSQLLIVWSGNLAEEIPWYLGRLSTSWLGVGVLLLLLQFFVPFFLLLSRPFKRHMQSMLWLSCLLLLMLLINAFWIVMPDLVQFGFRLHWLDLAAPLAIGGIWVWSFLRQLEKRPLLPATDPRLPEVLPDAARA
jgi:hypothetical protein